MADEQENKSPDMPLPPKLSARRVVAAQARAQETAPAPSVASPAPEPPVRQAAGIAAETVAPATVSPEAPAAAAAAVAAAPEISAPAGVTPVQAADAAVGTVAVQTSAAAAQGAAGPAPRPSGIPATVVASRLDRKKETSKLSLDDARPAPPGIPAVQTIRMKKEGGPAAEMRGIVRPASGAEGHAKGDTSRLALEDVIVPGAKPPDQGLQEVRTIKISKKTAAPDITLVTPQAGEEPADSSVSPSTIRLKKPDITSRSDFAKVVSATARINLDEGIPVVVAPGVSTPGAAIPASVPAAVPAPSEQPSGGPRTIKIKRPGEATAVPQMIAGTARTIKIGRPGPAPSAPGKAAEATDTTAAPAAEAPAAPPEPQEDMGDAVSMPLTQKRTIALRKQEAPLSERSQRMAEEEAKLGIRQTVSTGAPLEGGAQQALPTRERFLWIWCSLSAAAIIVISLVAWVIAVQVAPKNQNLNWPGRLLQFNHSFYNGERDLL